MRFVAVRSILLDNITFYLPEFNVKPTETSKKSQIFGKHFENVKFLGKNCKNFKFFGINCKFLERTAEISKF